MTNGKSRQFASLGLLLVILAAGALTGCSTPLKPPGAKTRVYVADTTQNNVLAFIINDILTGTLTPTGSPIAANCNGPAAFAKTPSGKFAYVLCEFSNQFSGFAIDRATNGLTPAGASTTGNIPVAAAIDLGSRFLYVANSGSNSVTSFSIDSATGAATAIGGATVTTNFAPNGLAIVPGGSFLYVSAAFGNSGDIEGFSINGMGALAEIAGSPFAAGNEPFGVSVDFLGRFLYTANFVGNDVSGFSIDTNTGKLSPVPGSPFAVGASPARAVVDKIGRAHV